MIICPTIEKLGGRVLSKKKYSDAYTNNKKHVEIDVVKTSKLVLPRVPYSHFAFHLGRRVLNGRRMRNLVAANLGCIGPFTTRTADMSIVSALPLSPPCAPTLPP